MTNWLLMTCKLNREKKFFNIYDNEMKWFFFYLKWKIIDNLFSGIKYVRFYIELFRCVSSHLLTPFCQSHQQWMGLTWECIYMFCCHCVHSMSMMFFFVTSGPLCLFKFLIYWYILYCPICQSINILFQLKKIINVWKFI